MPILVMLLMAATPVDRPTVQLELVRGVGAEACPDAESLKAGCYRGGFGLHARVERSYTGMALKFRLLMFVVIGSLFGLGAFLAIPWPWS